MRNRLTQRKAIAILLVMQGEKQTALKNVSRFRWNETMKEQARRLLQEDIDALQIAVTAIKLTTGIK